jgi:DNA helicase-2/ATP-dependent DNA helicase PcrA
MKYLDQETTRQPITLTDAQSRAADPERKSVLVTGGAGSGRTEALAERLARLASRSESALAIARTTAGASALRRRAEARISDQGFEPIECLPVREAAARLLAAHGELVGSDAFFDLLGPGERVALMLDEFDQLPLRLHEIRGNPGGLLARIVTRIDTLKDAGTDSTGFRSWAVAKERAAENQADLDLAERELEFAELFETHDRLVREAGGIDGGEAILALTALLAEHPSAATAIAERHPALVVDELEILSAAELRLVGALAKRAATTALACDLIAGSDGGIGIEWARRAIDGLEEVTLEGCHRHDERISMTALAAADVEQGQIEGEGDSGSGAVDFWVCENERAEAQAAAREIETMLSNGVPGGEICVALADTRAEREIAAALTERHIPFRSIEGRGFLSRAKVRDAIAWLRLLADPTDGPAAVRVLGRAPIELRSVDVASCTSIARRRKLDMVSASEAALESPQLPQDARERIREFLGLYAAASKAMEAMTPDVFVRRLIERIGLRRERLYGATTDTVERLRELSRLDEFATAWARRHPTGSNRSFVNHLITVSEADLPFSDDRWPQSPDTVQVGRLDRFKGNEFEAVFVLGLKAGALSGERPAAQLPVELAARRRPAEETARLGLYSAMTRARERLILSRPKTDSTGERAGPAPAFERARATLKATEDRQVEEIFGPAEGLHAAYRMIQEEALEGAWRAGGGLGDPRLDAHMDIHAAVARFLESIKLAALIQKRDEEPLDEALEHVNQLLSHDLSVGQSEALGESKLDEFILAGEAERERSGELVAERDEPSLEAFLPRKGQGMALSATDIDLYRTCPLKYKFARVFGIPQQQTVNQRVGIAIHQVLERYHDPESQQTRERLMALFVEAWRKGGFGESDDEIQFHDRAVEALKRYYERSTRLEATPRWLEKGFDFTIGPHHLRGRVDRVDALPEGGFELIDYKTGDPKAAKDLRNDVQLAIYQIAAKESWGIEEPTRGSFWYVLADEKVAVDESGDERERIEALTHEVGEGIASQDFEPRPSPTICNWCDFKLICPASEGRNEAA